MPGFTKEWYEAHQAKRQAPKKGMPNDRATKAKAKKILSQLSAKDKVKAKDQKRRAKEAADRHFSAVCTAAGLPPPIAEHKFHESRKWRIDYYFRRGEVKVALEIEGGLWVEGGGGHNRPTHFLRQIEKYNALSAKGIYLIRTTPTDLMTQGVRDVLRVFEEHEL